MSIVNVFNNHEFVFFKLLKELLCFEHKSASLLTGIFGGIMCHVSRLKNVNKLVKNPAKSNSDYFVPGLGIF